MRSFVGLLPQDAGRLRRLAAHIRLPSSSEPAIAGCLATVEHRQAAARIASDESAAIAGNLDDDARVLELWRRYGSGCVAQLHGEFSFAVWDAATEELFCARDRLGFRPFYYARLEGGIVFSDSLEAVLAHPDVSLELDDASAGDFLAGGVTDDAEATIYAAVRRLPPAHTLTFRRGGLEIVRYWSPDIGQPAASGRGRGEIRPPEALEVALKSAIRDRLTGSSAVVFMSGGLDSTAIAAMAHEVRPDIRLLAGTSVYRSRIDDVEERFARDAAQSIGIPIEVFVLDQYRPLQSMEEQLWTADPGALLTAAMTRDIYAIAAAHAAIALHGHPADAVLWAEPKPFLDGLLRRGRLGTLAAALVQYALVTRRPPYFFFRPARRAKATPPPDWLKVPTYCPEVAHPLASPEWASYFEWAHPLQTGAPIELVYPWGDVRVIETAAVMPPVPWLVDKHVVRELLRGRVRETIRKRPKTYLRNDPWIVTPPPEPRIHAASRYIDAQRLGQAVRAAGVLVDATLRAVAFEYWLDELQRRVAALRAGP